MLPCLPFFDRIGGTVLLCGSAESSEADLQAAWGLRPTAPVWCVNEAFYVVRSTTVLTQHYEQAGRMRHAYRKLYNDDPVIHARLGSQGASADVDHWWEVDGYAGGSSGIWAALVCSMVFDEVILCGIPLSHGRYHQAIRSNDFVRRGERTWTGAHGAVENYQAHVRHYVAEGLLHNVKSMSGFTRDVLGGIE